MVTDKEWNETKELLQDLFGNADAALKFHDNIIPLDEKVTNGTIHMALMMQQNICRHCKRETIFTECRHYVKRTVDNCDGAFDIKSHELDERPGLTKACTIKLKEQIGWKD